MFEKARKILLIVGACAAMVAASPAHAGYLQTFYNEYGQVVGQYVYNDNGQLCEYWGYGTYNYDYLYFAGNTC